MTHHGGLQRSVRQAGDIRLPRLVEPLRRDVAAPAAARVKEERKVRLQQHSSRHHNYQQAEIRISYPVQRRRLLFAY